MRAVGKVLRIVLAIVGGALFLWMVVFKVVSRLAARLGHSAPCPYALARLVDNPIRRRYMGKTMDRIDIQPGERVLELGPGPGAFTVRAAQRTGGEGRVVAVDIQPQMIAQVEKRVREAGLDNVETRVASAYDLPLADRSVDRAFLITVLPEIPDQARALAELRRVLRDPEPASFTDGETAVERPGGVLSITEEFSDPDYPFAGETIRRVEAAGFRLEQRLGNLWVYTLNFRKVAAPEE